MTKVLYIEHDDDNLYMLKMRLERFGDFEVLAARDSEKGCKLAVTEHPDVILMDLEMPVVDRWEPVRRLKNVRRPATSRSSACPHMRWRASARQAIATGCDEFDAKPIEFEVSGRHHSARRCEPQIIHPPVSGCAPPGRRTVNTEPLPGSLVTVTSPPIMRASLRRDGEA